MSTTAKIKNELVRLLSLEENKAGLTFSEVWEKLEQTDFKEELYNVKGERRSGTLVGLTTRIKQNKVQGIKVIKNNNQLVYISSNNEIEYLVNLTEKYLQQATTYKLKADKYSDDQRKVITEYGSILTQLQEISKKLKLVSDEVELAKVAVKSKEEPTVVKTEVKEAVKVEAMKEEAVKEEPKKVAENKAETEPKQELVKPKTANKTNKQATK
ncbi:hypothetical protein FG877_02215 [Enterococcus casseliflavus]|nr:hypothetical protein [Enterococcus casseliflavus]